MNKVLGRGIGSAPDQPNTMANADETTFTSLGAGGRKPSPDSSLSGAASRHSRRHGFEIERTETNNVTNAGGTTSL